MVEVSEDVKLRRASNFLLPIFSLGDDILRLIFTINSHINVPLFTFEWAASASASVVHRRTTRLTSQVCFRWRILCLSSPTLWSNIDICDSRIRWRDKVLRRSAQSSVALTYFDESVDADEDFVLLLPRLRAFIGNVNQWTALIDEVQRPGSQLRSIALYHTPGSDRKTDFRVSQSHSESFPLPLKLFAIHSGNIANLDFRFFSNLSSLSLISVHCDSLKLLRGLLQMPALTELALRDVSCKDVPLELQPVPLPNLTHLEMGGVEIHEILFYLNIPATCIIWIDCDMVLNNESLLPLLSKSAHQLTSAGGHSLTLTVRRTCVAFSSTPIGFQHSLKSRMQHSMVKLHLYFVRQNVEEWTSSLYECFPLLFDPGYLFTSITTLQLHAPYLCATDSPPFPLESFKHITTLFVESKTLGWLLSVIFDNDENRILFPSLKRLVVTVKPGLSDLNRLTSYLVWRYEHHACIDTLELRYISNGERRISEVTLAQCDKLESIDVALDLFYIVAERYLTRTVFVKAPRDCEHHVYELEPLDTCS